MGLEDKLLELHEQTIDRPRDFWTGSRWTPEEAYEHHFQWVRYQNLYYDLTSKVWRPCCNVPSTENFGKRRYLETHYPGDYTKKEECCEFI